MKFAKIISLLLCVVMLASVFAGCANGDNEGDEGQSNSSATGGTEDGTKSEVDLAIEEIEKNATDMSDQSFYILARDGIEESFYIESDSSDPLDQGVFERNIAFQDAFGIEVQVKTLPDAEYADALSQDVRANKEFTLSFGHTDNAITYAQSGLLYNFLSMPHLNLKASWWDKGTASFNIADSVWFMNGSFNTDDDDCTYVLLFNKKLYNNYFAGAEKTFYDVVNDKEWTLDYFNTVTQNVSTENGDGKWDENDTYGFVTTWEYGTTFFYGSGLNYVICEEGKDPYIAFEEGSMEKASQLLDKVLDIYYTNNATYWAPGGEEKLGLTAFTEGRALFYGEVVSYIQEANSTMTDDFGVLPIPKYDTAQENYITWTHGISSSMTIVNHVEDADKLGTLIEAFAVYSAKYVTPAYYDTVLQRKAIRDEESGPMLDLIFAGRTYDLAMYMGNLGLTNVFKTCVNDNKNTLSSDFARVSKTAQRTLTNVIKNFEKLK